MSTSFCSCHKKAYNFHTIQVIISQSSPKLKTNRKWTCKKAHISLNSTIMLDATTKVRKKKKIRHEIKPMWKTAKYKRYVSPICRRVTKKQRGDRCRWYDFYTFVNEMKFLKRWQKHILDRHHHSSRVGVIFDYNYLINLTPFAAFFNLTKMKEKTKERKKEHERTWMQNWVRHICK